MQTYMISMGHPRNWEIRMSAEDFARFFNAPPPTAAQITEAKQLLEQWKHENKTVAIARNDVAWLFKADRNGHSRQAA